jgi:hypothetical protein
MNVRLILGIASFFIAMGSCLIGNLTYYSMIDEINKTRPRDKELSYFGFGTRLNFFEHLNEYHALYPSGRLRRKLRIAMITMFAGLAAVAACLMLRFN